MATGRIPTTANSPLTVKGDLFGYSTTQARVPVGNDGETLVADSSTSTGLSYQANWAAGKNKIINGNFGVWQRGTSISLTNTTTAFVADRFTATSYFTAGSSTFTQQSFTPGTAPASPYESPFFGRLTLGSTATYFELAQKIEDVRTCAGQVVTFSFWAKASVSTPFNVIFRQNFGTGGSSNVDIFGTATTLTTSWQRFTFSTTLGAMTGKTIGAGSNLQLFIYASGSVTNSQTIDTWGWQLEQASTATAFQTATGTIQGELAACQRYYYRTSASGVNYIFGLAQCYGTTTGGAVIPLPVPMRISPTALEQSGTANQYQAYSSSGAALALTSVPTFAAVVTSQFQAAVNFTVGSGLTGGNVTQFTAANSSAFLGWSAEL
jgi:hypothetical protein